VNLLNLHMKKFSALLILLTLIGIRAFSQNPSSPYSSDIKLRLLEAASYNDYPVVLDCIKKGADVNALTWDNISPLMYAVSFGNKQMVKILLDKGAKVNVQPMNGFSALSTAAKYGFTDIALMLIADSANVNQVNAIQATALHYASLYNNDTIVFSLLNAGANPNLLTYDSISPLTMAAINGSYESAYQLIGAGAEINIADKHGFTPLMLAAQNGYPQVVELLLNNDANVNLQNKKGYSALSLAILNKHPDIVNMLLENGANVNELNSLSTTPKTLAKISGDTAIIHSIKKAKAKGNILPAFTNLGAGLELNFNSRDFMTGFYFTQNDAKFNLNYNFGFAFRPAAITLMETIPKYGYYQFRERRYYFHFDLTKGFGFDVGDKSRLSINAGARLLYNFGKYKATDIQINGGINLAPIAWVAFKKNNFESRFGYHYSNYGESELPKSHYTIGVICYLKNFNANKYNRSIKWID
jgi:ankyrin repeat protein